MSARYGLRGVRIGEASHPGPPLLRRLRRRRVREISSDEEPLMRGIARNVIPRIAEVEFAPGATQIETSLATVPASQTALHEAGRRVSPDRVPMHVLDALEEDLEREHQVPRSPWSSQFALLVQNRFAVLDTTVRDSSGLMSTAVDGCEVEVDDGVVSEMLTPRRLVLTSRSVPVTQIDPDSHDERLERVRMAMVREASVAHQSEAAREVHIGIPRSGGHEDSVSTTSDEVSEKSVIGSVRDDAQSVEGPPSKVDSEEDGPDLRMGAVQARQISAAMDSMDQVVLVDILRI